MYSYQRLGAILIILCMLLLWLTSTPAEITTAAATSGIQGLQSDATGLSFQLQLPHVELTADGRLQASGLAEYLQEPGKPALPYYTAVIAVPPQATTQVTVSEKNAQRLNGVTLRPAGQPAPLIDESSDMVVGLNTQAMAYTPDPELYTTNALYPAQTYTVSPIQYARDVRFITLTLYPVRYNPVTQELHHTAELDVQINFDYDPAALTTQPLPTHSNSATQNLAAVALNGEQITQWRAAPETTQASKAAAVDLPTGKTVYKIAVDE